MTEGQGTNGNSFSITLVNNTNNYLTCSNLHPQAGIEKLSSEQKAKADRSHNGAQTESKHAGTKDTQAHTETHWFVMRDLKRRNTKTPAYKMLAENGFEVFTPMKKCQIVRFGRKAIEDVPVIQDMLFVHSSREQLDPTVAATPTLQYRYLKGGNYCEPAVVRDADMRKFIDAVNSADSPRYYTPDELTPGMAGQKVRIIGGPLNGYEARLLNIRGSRKKRIMVELPAFLIAGIEIKPEYIQLQNGKTHS